MNQSFFNSLALRASAAVIAFGTSAQHAFATSGIFGDVPTFGGATNARDGTIAVIQGVLGFMALIAVVVIVIAGIRMVVSSGEEGPVESAKKTILWAVVGLIIILMAGAIVDFIASEVATQVAP